MTDDYAQQHIPRLDLRWLADLVNVLADHRSDVEHLAIVAAGDDSPALVTALDRVKGATIAAEAIALRLAREHGVSQGIVGDVARNALAEVTP